MLTPCSIDKPYISLDNKMESQFLFAIFEKKVKVLDQKKFLTNNRCSSSRLKFLNFLFS